MKATEEFNQDFRPKTRSRHEEEDPDTFFFPYYDDPRINIRKICRLLEMILLLFVMF